MHGDDCTHMQGQDGQDNVGQILCGISASVEVIPGCVRHQNEMSEMCGMYSKLCVLATCLAWRCSALSVIPHCLWPLHAQRHASGRGMYHSLAYSVCQKLVVC